MQQLQNWSIPAALISAARHYAAKALAVHDSHAGALIIVVRYK